MSNKDTIIEALTMQLKLEREGNLALAKRIAELEKPVYVDSSRFSKGPSDHKPGMVITEPVQAIAEDKWEPQIEHRYSPNGDLISITIKRTPDGEREQIHPLKRECVGQPDLARVGEVGVWGDKREWVGLTDEAIWLEYQQLWPFHPAEEPTLAKDIAKFARAIEAKLKEKNT
jgi:hypothetical protein